MFSQACVKNSVHRRRESGRQTRPLAGRHGPWQADTPLAGRLPPPPGRQTSPLFLAGRHPPSPWQADIPSWQADTPPGRQTPPPEGTPPPDGHCSGRYESYRNVFLLTIHLVATYQI